MTSRSSGYETNSEKLLHYLYLTKFDDVIQSGFWVIPKTTSANLCKPIYDITNFFTSIRPSVSGNRAKEVKKYKNVNILRTKRAF